MKTIFLEPFSNWKWGERVGAVLSIRVDTWFCGGASGEAYMAEQDGQKLFLKRNSNPFIAALSAEDCT